MQMLQQSRVQSQRPPTQWNLRAADEAVFNKVVQDFEKLPFNNLLDKFFQYVTFWLLYPMSKLCFSFESILTMTFLPNLQPLHDFPRDLMCHPVSNLCMTLPPISNLCMIFQQI